MSGVPIDLSCPDCGADHPHHDAVEEAILSGMRPGEIQWVCPDCESVVQIDHDVAELGGTGSMD